MNYGPPVPIVFDIIQASVGNVLSLCFTGEVGTVYGLHKADVSEGPYTDTGARTAGTGTGPDYLVDPDFATGIDTGKFYRIIDLP